MTTTTPTGGALARQEPAARDLAQTSPLDEYELLDVYDAPPRTDVPRVPWLATIGAGYKDTTRDPPIPRASRKTDPKWIHMTREDQERAPGLYAALEQGSFRWLEIALPFDDPHLFLQQHFEKRSATRLEAFGDRERLTEIVLKNGDKRAERRTYEAGTAEYAALKPQCKVTNSFFFTLAHWEAGQPHLYFPDGLGVYRVRCTSRNSPREIMASLRQVGALTGGRLAGLPLRLTLDWREAADPLGMKRAIGVWSVRFAPPEEIVLTPRLWQGLAQKALAEGDMLHVPLPTAQTIDQAAQEFEEPDLDEPAPAVLQALQAGPPCDARFYQQAWFARVRGTSLDSDEARAAFLDEYTGGAVDSLSTYLEHATEAEAAALIAAAGVRVGRENLAGKARRYEEIFGDPYGPISTPHGQVDTSTGEVLEEARPMAGSPSRQELWAINRQLVTECQRRGIAGGPTLNVRAGEDALILANQELRRRLDDYAQTHGDGPPPDDHFALAI